MSLFFESLVTPFGEFVEHFLELYRQEQAHRNKAPSDPKRSHLGQDAKRGLPRPRPPTQHNSHSHIKVYTFYIFLYMFICVYMIYDIFLGFTMVSMSGNPLKRCGRSVGFFLTKFHNEIFVLDPFRDKKCNLDDIQRIHVQVVSPSQKSPSD